MNDLRYSARALFRSPAFAAVAIAALALGIGANTAIFSVVHTVLLLPLPYPDPSRLVMVWENSRALGRPHNPVAPASFLEWQAQNRGFEHMAAYRILQLSLTGVGEPEDLQVQRASSDFFRVLGIQAALGRTFTAEDDRPKAPLVVVLSHRLWQRRFGGDPQVIGRSLVLGGDPATVVGVMGADFLPVPPQGELPEIWEPLRLEGVVRIKYLSTIARLKPGVAWEQAQSELDTIAQRLEQQYPEFNKGWRTTVVPLAQEYLGEVRRALWVLLGAVGFVLLISCADVANLLLARAAARQKEMAVRASLGAGRWRLIRQMLAESLLLAGLGGAAGLVLAVWSVKILAALAPKTIPRLNQVQLDSTVLAFSVAISVLTGLIFGLTPALAASRTNLQETLKEGGSRTGTSGSSQWFRRGLVVVEIALSLVLLVGAGLLIRGFLRLRAIDPGFRSENLLTLRVQLPGLRPKHQTVSFFQTAVQRIGALPGVQSAGAINFLPFSGLVSATYFAVEGRPVVPLVDQPVAEIVMVTPGYFRTMGIPLLRGRVFTAQDGAENPRVYVINQSMARIYFSQEDPIGKRLAITMLGDRTPGEIVGIVGDVRHDGFEKEAFPMVFYAAAQFPYPYMVLVVRTSSDPRLMARSAVAVIRSMDPNQPVSQVRSMEEVLSESVSRARFTTFLLGIFAGIALLLAIVGVYGVMSYMVTQRTREIGIRMALGATRLDVLRIVLRHDAVLTLIGLGIGLAGALALTRLMSSFLFGISATDPSTFGGTALLLGAVSLLAAWLPARRAARVDPVVALRYE